MNEDTAILIENLSKQYEANKNTQNTGSEQLALNDVSFKVNKGETIALIGSNGSGKSTLLSILGGISKPTKGKVSLRGRVTSILDIGSNFHPDLTGRENAKLFFTLNQFKKEDLKSLIAEVKQFSGLDDYFEKPIKYYSKGMFIRLAFTTAFLQDADIYLLDEVLSVGDHAFRLKTNLVFNELKEKKKTLIIATHDKQEVMAMSNRCIWLDKGKLIKDDKPQKVVLEYSKFQRFRFENELFETNKRNVQQTFIPDEGKDDIDLKFDKGKYSNENLELLGIKISGAEKGKIYKEEEIAIQTKVLKKFRENILSAQIKIRDEYEQPVLFSLSLYNKSESIQDKSTQNYEGNLSFECKIPANLLASGQYYVSFYFGKDSNPEEPEYNERAFHFPHEVSFRVSNKSYEFVSEPEHFSILPALEWDIKKEAN